MKNWIICACIVFGTQVRSQDNTEIVTIVLKLEDLITYVADNYPKNTHENIYILTETNETGLDTDERFYAEQGILLLCKRINEDGKIAIGTYGLHNDTILPFTSASQEEYIKKSLSDFSNLATTNDQDGIDLAYQNIERTAEEGITTKVILLRNDKIHRQIPAVANISHTETKKRKSSEEHVASGKGQKLGGAIAITALSILPEVLDVIKD